MQYNITCFAFKCNSFIMKHRNILPNEVNAEYAGRGKKLWNAFANTRGYRTSRPMTIETFHFRCRVSSQNMHTSRAA
jgi:hypothetical protein